MKIILWFLMLSLTFKTFGQSNTLEQAKELYVLGHYTKAIKQYKSHENPEAVYQNIAQCYQALGNYDLALSYYIKGIKTHPDNQHIKYQYAKLLVLTKQYKDASILFDELINLDYRNPNYHYNLGLVLEHLKDSTSQNRFWNTFLLDSTHQKAIFKLAKFHLIKRNHKQSHKYIDVGLKTYANNKDLINLKAQNYYWQKKYKASVKWFETLLSLNEKTVFIYKRLSFCYTQLHHLKKAIDHLILALDLEPKNPDIMLRLANLYKQNEDFVNAEMYYKKAILLIDTPLDIEYVNLATTLNNQQKYKESIEVLKKAIKENPNKEYTHFLMLMVKTQYYKDIDTKIRLHEAFLKKYSENSTYNTIVTQNLQQLKEEKFMNKQ